MTELSFDTTFFEAYSNARRQFLRAIGCDDSCRDPLAEFAERLVYRQIGGTLADSRVQKGYDLVCPYGRQVQVKYLASPLGRWRNEHTVAFSDETNDYALVVFEGFDVRGILIFRRETLGDVCAALKKRHPNPESVLQFTQANFNHILSRPAEFELLGVRVFLPRATPA
jgi:hypothetical protein